MQTRWMAAVLAMAMVMAMALAGCGGGGGSEPDVVPNVTPGQTPQERIAALEAAGSLPRLERSGTVAGIDANSNLVRDDVETFVSVNYSTDAQRAAATQFAAVMQAAMVADKADAAATKAISIKGARAVNCIYSKFSGAAGSKQPALVVEEVRSISTNTKARLLAYLAYSKALDGTAGTLPEGDTCE